MPNLASHFTPRHSTSHHVTARHTITHQVTPCHTISHHITACHSTSQHVTALRTMSHQVIPCHTISHHVTACHSTCLAWHKFIAWEGTARQITFVSFSLLFCEERKQQFNVLSESPPNIVITGLTVLSEENLLETTETCEPFKRQKCIESWTN